MGLLDGLMGNASEIEPERIEGEFARVLAPGERIEKAYLLPRDLFHVECQNVLPGVH